MNEILTQLEVHELATAIQKSGIDYKECRSEFIRFIDINITGYISKGKADNLQILHDLGIFNGIERQENGDVPLQIYLTNAAFILAGYPKQREVIVNMLDKVFHGETGAPRPDLTTIPETKEAIIFRDDMVTFGFMEDAVKIGASVFKLIVPSFENGKPRLQSKGNQLRSNGTGWLLTKTLLITNHHVINARRENEKPASVDDLRLQASKAKAMMDFNDDDFEGALLEIEKLEAWDVALDYAVLRIADIAREPLILSTKEIKKVEDAYPVNIIQHPSGKSKRYGIRNNLVSGVTKTDLCYFTDTETGSSGSPVLNDSWEVVALHRASTNVNGVKFQGKTTAVVNMGTHIHLIKEHIQTNFPGIFKEL